MAVFFAVGDNGSSPYSVYSIFVSLKNDNYPFSAAGDRSVLF